MEYNKMATTPPYLRARRSWLRWLVVLLVLTMAAVGLATVIRTIWIGR
jgi:hypothetical protein